jgi:heat shock protein HslJ
MRHLPFLLALTVLPLAFAQAQGTEDPHQLDNPAPPTTAAASVAPALESHRWTLVVASDAESRRIDALFPTAGRPYTFTFAGAMLNVQGGCNTLGGSYQINAAGLLEVGSMRTTMMACAPELMQADTAMAALLAQPMQFAVTQDMPPQLQLRTAANATLALQGQVTPEALYGAGTLIFLEVDARQFPCRNPRNGQTTCLQVRTINFDEQGLRSGPAGPWQPFYDSIEGYTHTPGQRNVLRVKRFDRGVKPGDAAAAIYVLDLIVETETTPQ